MTKTLEDMSLEELWQLFPIVLTSHQDAGRTGTAKKRQR